VRSGLLVWWIAYSSSWSWTRGEGGKVCRREAVMRKRGKRRGFRAVSSDHYSKCLGLPQLCSTAHRLFCVALFSAHNRGGILCYEQPPPPSQQPCDLTQPVQSSPDSLSQLIRADDTYSILPKIPSAMAAPSCRALKGSLFSSPAARLSHICSHARHRRSTRSSKRLA
jgi:hypothetical protein